MKTLIVFYSRTGTTRKVAEELAKKFNADKEEIIDLRNRKGIFGYIIAGRDAIRGKLTDIKETKIDPSKYDLTILGTPNWGGNITPAMRMYVRCNKDKFGHVACFCTMGGENPGKVFLEFEKELGKKSLFNMSARTKDVYKNQHQSKLNEFYVDLTKTLNKRRK